MNKTTAPWRFLGHAAFVVAEDFIRCAGISNRQQIDTVQDFFDFPFRRYEILFVGVVGHGVVNCLSPDYRTSFPADVEAAGRLTVHVGFSRGDG